MVCIASQSDSDSAEYEQVSGWYHVRVCCMVVGTMIVIATINNRRSFDWCGTWSMQLSSRCAQQKVASHRSSAMEAGAMTKVAYICTLNNCCISFSWVYSLVVCWLGDTVKAVRVIVFTNEQLAKMHGVQCQVLLQQFVHPNMSSHIYPLRMKVRRSKLNADL